MFGISWHISLRYTTILLKFFMHYTLYIALKNWKHIRERSNEKNFHNNKCDVTHQMVFFCFFVPYTFKHKLIVWFRSVFFFFDLSTNSSLISCFTEQPHSLAKPKWKTIEFLLFVLRCNYRFRNVYNNMWLVC